MLRILVYFFLFLGPLTARDSLETVTPRSASDLLAIQERVQGMLPAAKRATVAVLGDGSGTGVVVSRSGLVLTAGHVCGERGTKLDVILSDGKAVKAISLGALDKEDAGLVQLEEGRYRFAKMRTVDDTVSLGTWVVAVGHPGGFDYRRGAVARLGRVISISKDTVRTDCKLVGGDSGGPLFDLKGRLVAIHSRISRAPDQNFHVPLSVFRQEWSALMP